MSAAHATRLERLGAFARKRPEVEQGMFDPGAFEQRILRSPLARSDQEREQALAVHQRLLRNETVTPPQLHLYEAIVLRTERPALLIQNDSYLDAPEPWTSLRLPAARELLTTGIRAVGRVEISGPTSKPYAGTAFVVGPGLLMTNSHVAALFATGTGLRARFKNGFGAAIDFKREQGSTSQRLHHVGRVRMIHPYWDMALLEVEGLSVAPLSLDPVPPEDCVRRKVALIGYPARDDEDNDPELQDRMFGEVYQVKRLAPGFCLGKKPLRSRQGHYETLAHDSSTLGGNSGSAVIDIETGKVLGLHFAGIYLVANYAVPAYQLGLDGRVRDAGVQFASGAAVHPNPWEAGWQAPETPSAAAPHAQASSVYTVRIPIEITIKVGRPHDPGASNT